MCHLLQQYPSVTISHATTICMSGVDCIDAPETGLHHDLLSYYIHVIILDAFGVFVSVILPITDLAISDLCRTRLVGAYRSGRLLIRIYLRYSLI